MCSAEDLALEQNGLAQHLLGCAIVTLALQVSAEVRERKHGLRMSVAEDLSILLDRCDVQRPRSGEVSLASQRHGEIVSALGDVWMVVTESVLGEAQHALVQRFCTGEIVAIRAQDGPVVEGDREIGVASGRCGFEDADGLLIERSRLLEPLLQLPQPRKLVQRQRHFAAVAAVCIDADLERGFEQPLGFVLLLALDEHGAQAALCIGDLGLTGCVNLLTNLERGAQCCLGLGEFSQVAVDRAEGG